MQKNIWLILSLFAYLLTTPEHKAFGGQNTDENQAGWVPPRFIPNGDISLPSGLGCPMPSPPIANLCCQDLYRIEGLGECWHIMTLRHYPGDIDSNWGGRRVEDLALGRIQMGFDQQSWMK